MVVTDCAAVTDICSADANRKVCGSVFQKIQQNPSSSSSSFFLLPSFPCFLLLPYHLYLESRWLAQGSSVYLYQGKSGGLSIDVEISLEAGAMERLEMDKSFLMDY
ncbi:hypothetical protein MLD38_033533 [Melastoma candidum]|uniref:Uncharacterized protein n=1 Tax=Melastoma candidum TaxID=119954 RepID=A0ACB9M772_9MYRT|nr:hypothetical protein MLD38_033533 [Melastoma candidum]